MPARCCGRSGGGHGPTILRLVVGNPLDHEGDGRRPFPTRPPYAPVTILVDERADGVHLSYDSMASLVAPYGSQSAVAVASDLDAHVLRLLEGAADGENNDHSRLSR